MHEMNDNSVRVCAMCDHLIDVLNLLINNFEECERETMLGVCC